MYIYIYYTSFSRDFHHLNLVSYRSGGEASLQGRHCNIDRPPIPLRCAVAGFFRRCRPGIWCWTSSAQFARHQLTSWLDAQKISCLRNDLCNKYADMGIVWKILHIYIYICSIICWMNHIDMDDNPSTGTGGAWWSTTRRGPIRQALHRWHAQVITGMVQCQILKKILASHGNCMESYTFMHSGATKLQEQVQSLIPKSASCRSELREAAPMLLRSHCGSISDHRFFTQGSACGFTARWRSYGSEAETKAQWIGLRENLQKKTYVMGKSMVSKPIHWKAVPFTFHDLRGKCARWWTARAPLRDAQCPSSNLPMCQIPSGKLT